MTRRLAPPQPTAEFPSSVRGATHDQDRVTGQAGWYIASKDQPGCVPLVDLIYQPAKEVSLRDKETTVDRIYPAALPVSRRRDAVEDHARAHGPEEAPAGDLRHLRAALLSLVDAELRAWIKVGPAGSLDLAGHELIGLRQPRASRRPGT